MKQRVDPPHSVYLRALATLNLFVACVSANTEHKVHNIVLYPDKHSWCKTTAIKQVIAYPGCDSVIMDNNVCVGACFSYSIPRTVPSAPGEVLPYCDSCQPSSNTTLKHVTLRCTSGEYEGEIMNKRVEIITNCSCMTCANPLSRGPFPDDLEGDSAGDGDLEESLDDSPGTSLLDVPQLLGLMGHSSSFRTAEKQTSNKSYSMHLHAANRSGLANSTLINERLVRLLAELNAGTEQVSADNQLALKELLTRFEGESNHRVNDATTLQDLLKRVEKEGHINIDLERLREVLLRLETAEKHKGTQTSSNAHRHQHMLGPHHSLVLGGPNAHIAHDMIHSGVFLAPTLDVASHHLKPAIPGSELSYHDNLVPTDESQVEVGPGEHPEQD